MVGSLLSSESLTDLITCGDNQIASTDENCILYVRSSATEIGRREQYLTNLISSLHR